MAKKPINSIRIAMYALIALAGIGLLTNITRLGSRVATRTPKSAQTQKPTTVAPDTVTNFEQQEREQVKKLQEETQRQRRRSPRPLRRPKVSKDSCLP